jgi:putative ABC transport system permease protein
MSGGAYVTITPLADIVGDQQREWRLGATMFVAFGSLALLLGAIGLYSVIAYGVEQRSRELSIRIALGAVLALAGGRWVTSLLFDEPANDPLVFSIVAIVLLLVSFAASAIPAFRAPRLDPSVALRAD